jgi:hypothetical protein
MSELEQPAEAQEASESGESVKPVAELVQEANERLTAAGSESAEQAFGLGCALGAIPGALVVLVLYILNVFNLILAMIVLAILALALTGAAAVLANRARRRREDDTYRLWVEPEIQIYLQKNQLSQADFKRQADEILTQDAPLRAYLFQTRAGKG